MIHWYHLTKTAIINLKKTGSPFLVTKKDKDVFCRYEIIWWDKDNNFWDSLSELDLLNDGGIEINDDHILSFYKYYCEMNAPEAKE